MKLERAKKAGRKFLAPVETHVGGFRTMVKVLPELLRGQRSRSPQVTPGPFHTDPAVYATPPVSGLRVTWFGHSALLCEIDGLRLLVDPVWDQRAAPVQWFGPKRFFPPTIALADLPKLDAVLISHDHYDHLGAGTIRELARVQPGVQWITSLGVGEILRSFGADHITELNWTQSADVGALKITSLPARHFSGRSLLNRNETLWASFALQGPRHSVYYGADSGLWDGFAAIGAEYGPFDVTLLEIGAFNELWKDIHLGPDGALEAFRMLGGGLLMPIHWGLFDLALHPWRQPIERAVELARERGIALFSPLPGMPSEIGAAVSDWWCEP
jgi:L-ascorbate metabolism protein UlaG (beta-lactamase superfamily)